MPAFTPSLPDFHHRLLDLDRQAGRDDRPVQLSTDGLDGYPATVEEHLGGAAWIWHAGENLQGGNGGGRALVLSGADNIGGKGRGFRYPRRRSGICTSYVERTNLHIHMSTRRFTR
jgi:hypothetical protein